MCEAYHASGRYGSIVPLWVVQDGLCLGRALGESELPNWARLDLGTSCGVEVAWDATLHGDTKFADWRVEHIALQLLVDSKLATRLTFDTDNVRQVVLVTEGILALGFLPHNMGQLAALSGDDARHYVMFLWEHLVNFAIEIYVFGGSGALSRFSGLAQFSKEEAPKLVARFRRCRAQAGSFEFLAAQESSSQSKDEAIMASLQRLMPRELFEQWKAQKEQFQAVSAGQTLRLYDGSS